MMGFLLFCAAALFIIALMALCYYFGYVVAWLFTASESMWRTLKNQWHFYRGLTARRRR